ncbi:MAG: hypothetical protein HQL66_15505, partial [Magnetococcales bacterium]|nr:hypothetical protein [Magnetococcales bacterium]
MNTPGLFCKGEAGTEGGLIGGLVQVSENLQSALRFFAGKREKNAGQWPPLKGDFREKRAKIARGKGGGKAKKRRKENKN